MTHRENRLNRKGIRLDVERASQTSPVAVVPPTDPVAETVDYSGLSKADLKALAALRGVSVSGTKQDIIDRLEE